MNGDAVYATASANVQKNLTLKFSRRARGIPIWAALRALGRDGVASMVDRHCDEATWLAERLYGGGLKVLNRVVLNQYCYVAEMMSILQRSAKRCWTQALAGSGIPSGKAGPPSA